MKRLLRWTSIAVVALAGLWVVAGAGLAASPAPEFARPAMKLPPGVAIRRPPGCAPDGGVRCVRMRDGARLALHETAGDPSRVILLVHGVMGSAAAVARPAALLHASTGATVLRVDLRGHGASDGASGDVRHVGQYEEDLDDLVAALRRVRPGVRVVLAGHSMGGGVVLRYAERGLAGADGYLLFAPHLGHDAPTTRQAPPGRGEAPMKVHVPRVIGLAMLNAVRLPLLNGLPTLFFNVGEEFPIRAYTFRAMAGMAPDDHRAALAADDRPLLVLVGEKDEAFVASAYPAAARLHPGGRAVLIPDATHDGVLVSPAAHRAAAEWLRSF